ncbi:GNAT family N-acetyltransferase [Streptomyces cellulosae]
MWTGLSRAVARCSPRTPGRGTRASTWVGPERSDLNASPPAWTPRPGCLLQVADCGGRIVGHLAGSVAEGSAMRPVKVATLVSMYVQPDHRRGGLGKRLVTRFTSWAREEGGRPGRGDRVRHQRRCDPLLRTERFHESVSDVADLFVRVRRRSSRERGVRPDDSDLGVNQAPPAEVGTESTRSR